MTVITHTATHGRRHQSVSGQDPFGPLEVRRVPQVYFLPLLYGESNGAPPTMQCPLGGFSDQPPSLACGRLHSFFSPLVSIKTHATLRRGTGIARRKAEQNPNNMRGRPSRACVEIRPNKVLRRSNRECSSQRRDRPMPASPSEHMWGRPQVAEGSVPPGNRLGAYRT